MTLKAISLTNNWRAYQLYGQTSDCGEPFDIQIAIGEKYGIYEAMSELGQVTPAELGEYTGLSEQFALRWLESRLAEDSLYYDFTTDRYSLWCPWPRLEEGKYAEAV